MHIQKITFTLLFAAAALASNAQESKKKTQAAEENTKTAPAQVVDEAPHKGAPIPTSANTPQTQPTYQTQPAPQPAEQPMQAMPQTNTSGDKPVQDGALNQKKDKSYKKNIKENSGEAAPKK